VADVLRARESFAAASPDGAGYLVRAGDVLSASHPVVKGREHLFEPVENVAGRAVERATAAPGEPRVLGSPKVAQARARKSD
jgi:hypothetical protein